MPMADNVIASPAKTRPVARSLRSLLYGVTSRDAVVLVTAPVVLLAAALLAGFGPERRAARIDPAITLRAE